MHETEFAEALGRLLTDGRLRDLFATNPAEALSTLSMDASLRTELAALKFDELEAQAEVLLRKRLDVARTVLPALVCRLGPDAWPLFREYARPQWHPAPRDALHFAEFIRRENAGKIDAREINRLRFVLGSARLKLHLITIGNYRPALQILLRSHPGKWREFVFYPGLSSGTAPASPHGFSMRTTDSPA